MREHFRNEIDRAPYELQQQFVGTLCEGGILNGRSDRGRFTPALIPVGGPLNRTATDRVIVVGDAGGFVNGFTAEGIYYGMVTGDLAAKGLLAGAPSRFAKLWRAEIGAELRDSVLVQRFLFCNPDRIDAMVQGARRYPALARAVVNYAIGNTSYREARRRLICRFPSLLFRVLFDFPRTRHAIMNIPSQDLT